ncbi:MAG: zinc-finger domain-containing protein, partial [Bdellovibrionales bacterium]
QPEKIIVDDHLDGVACDGGGGALGHPKSWYSFDGQDCVQCGYCDRLFVKQRAAKTFQIAS